MQTAKTIEANFDGLVGTTHMYGGQAVGNLASQYYAHTTSNPKLAVKQGLDKMYLLHKLGIKQALLPPHPRPNLEFLEKGQFLEAYSAAGMWAANAATVSPACQTKDGRIHITPANLISNAHRAQESQINFEILSNIFNDQDYFQVHKPLPNEDSFADEGAANHAFISADYGTKGVEIFFYGRNGIEQDKQVIYKPRQTLDASERIVGQHQLSTENTILWPQNIHAINHGAFHSDVVFSANKNVILYHESALQDTDRFKKQILGKCNTGIYFIEVSNKDLNIDDAVKTYLFNSQIVTLADHSMLLIAPIETKQSKQAAAVVASIIEQDNPIAGVQYVDCRQSMRNGGGPACLRLRVPMSRKAFDTINPKLILSDALYDELIAWIDRYYRDTLSLDDLKDPTLRQESYESLDALTKILDLGNIYSFQRA